MGRTFVAWLRTRLRTRLRTPRIWSQIPRKTFHRSPDVISSNIEHFITKNENIEHRTQNETINIPLDENYADIETHGRPKRTTKITGKFIENRIQSDKSKLDKQWRNIVQFGRFLDI